MTRRDHTHASKPACPRHPFEILAGTPFHVYLPLIADADMTPLVPGQATRLTAGPAARANLDAMFPGMDPAVWDRLSATVPADSIYFDDGRQTSAAQILVLPTHRIPALILPGTDAAFVWSVNAQGATNFAAPATITYPNLDGLPAGTRRPIYYFDHDAGHWDVSGTMTVNADGTMFVSDPGSGIRTLGWRYIPRDPATCSTDTGPPPMSRPQATKTERTEVLPLVFGDSGGFPTLTFQAPDKPPDPSLLDQLQNLLCPPPRDPERQMRDPYLKVTISVEGPLSEFIKQSGSLPIQSQSLFLSAGRMETFGGEAIPFALALPQLNDNILYGSRIEVTQERGESDGSTRTEKVTYYLYRFLDATDAAHDDRRMDFEDPTVTGTSESRVGHAFPHRETARHVEAHRCAHVAEQAGDYAPLPSAP
jgi:hypothetical protein